LKTAAGGGAKKFMLIMAAITLSAVALLAWFQLANNGPVDKLSDQIVALSQADPDRAVEMYPQLIDLMDKNNISNARKSQALLRYGEVLQCNRCYEKAIVILNQSLALSRNHWPGTAESNTIVEIAQCKLALAKTQKLTQADIDSLTEAAKAHPPIEQSQRDKMFWPLYAQVLGRIYSELGDYPNADVYLQKAADQFEGDDLDLQESQAFMIDILVKQGKYAEANQKFIEIFCDLLGPEYRYYLPKLFRQSLLRVQDKDPTFATRVQDMLARKQFDELDKLAQEMLAAKKIAASGRWSVNDFYLALDSSENPDYQCPWGERIKQLEQWAKDRPQSAAAKIALGNELVSYAWIARGGGWASDVSKEGQIKFDDRLAGAEGVLNQVKDRTPNWYVAMQGCALGQGWSEKRYDALVAECQKRYPDYDTVIFNKCYWLQPRWHGQEGDYESYIFAEADKRPGAAGDILYARCVWNLDNLCLSEVQGKPKIAWARAKFGLREIIKQYPDSAVAKGALSGLAMENHDKQVALDAFAK